MAKLQQNITDEPTSENLEWFENYHKRISQIPWPENHEVGYVYILEMTDLDKQGWYKIGCTCGLENRLKKNRRKWGNFNVIATITVPMTDYYSLESQLHARFADKHIVHEFYRLMADDIAYLKSLKEDR